jgi:hypothetical protein
MIPIITLWTTVSIFWSFDKRVVNSSVPLCSLLYNDCAFIYNGLSCSGNWAVVGRSRIVHRKRNLSRMAQENGSLE